MATNTVKENLIAARALIDTPAKWIKGDFKRNGCFCAIGALREACDQGVHESDYSRAEAALYAAVPVLGRGHSGVMGLNDASGTTHADIMALFDCAIEAA